MLCCKHTAKAKPSEGKAKRAYGSCMLKRQSTWVSAACLPQLSAGSSPQLHEFWEEISKRKPVQLVVRFCWGVTERCANTTIWPDALRLIKKCAEFSSSPFRSHATRGYLIPLTRLNYTGCCHHAICKRWLNGQPQAARWAFSWADWLSNLRISFCSFW